MPSGVVAFWHIEEGWGGIRADDRPGVGFVIFGNIRMEGFRYLLEGERVEYEFGDDHGQDGCDWRAAWVRPLART